MIPSGHQLQKFWQIVPNTYKHLAPAFWAQEAERNRYRARYAGFSALVLLTSLSLIDLTRAPRLAVPISLINVVLIISNLLITCNEREPVRRLPLYPMFTIGMTLNIVGAMVISFLLEGIMQLSLTLFLVSVALLLVPGFSKWYLLPAIPLALSYIILTNLLSLPEVITTANLQMYTVFLLTPILVALLSRTSAKQRWEAFLSQVHLQEQKVALEEANNQLQKRNEELDAFAHTVAHDLKNPLTIVVGYAEIMLDDFQIERDFRWLDHVQQIILAGRKGNNIIQELLLLAAVRKEEIESAPIEMGGVVAQALERLSHHIEDDGVTVVQPETWPMAIGYAGWVEEVWVNYISNAIKYGGRPCCVELGADVLADGMVRYWVRDNGLGLSAKEQAVLFREFTRLDKTRAKGHGLGLSIVRRIMEKLNGRVGVESTLGEGSTFYFELPA